MNARHMTSEPRLARRWVRRVVLTILGLVTAVALAFGAIRGFELATAWGERLQQPTSALSVSAEPSPVPGYGTRVLVFYNPATTDCVSCDLQAWRLSLYTRDFRDAGAEVLGVAGGLRNGSPQLDAELDLPWEVVYDLSGTIARYHGVDYSGLPTVIVLDDAGRMLFREQPSDSQDRLEADILTTLFAARQEIPLDTDPTLARAR